MNKILDALRKKPEFYKKLKQIYGNTIGLWYFKDLFIKYIGLYNGKNHLKLLSENETNKVLVEKIKSGYPFMLTRYGSTEFRNLTGNKDFNLLCFYSGFFPKDPRLLNKFRQTYIESSKLIDFLIVWNYRNHFIKKVKLVKKFPNISQIMPDTYLKSAFEEKRYSWIKELKNKRVLVIHPFKTSIESQYKKNDSIKILPKFKSLEVIRAVQTIAGNTDERFKTWFDALEFMKKEIRKKDFDIAIIGCGAYGLPLAAYVKSLGKQALHLGGASQLLFGIGGKRWENSQTLNFNKFWIYPLKEDVPKNYKNIEGGCYWK